MPGTLYIVSTPIGNLSDLSFRALDTLKRVDLVAVEDSRVTGRLFKNYNIKNKFFIYNNFNENEKYLDLLEKLIGGIDIALVSDAGTPNISDPGYRIISESRKSGINIVSIPGPCSIVAALSISGLPANRFFYEGFLPKKKGRKKRFEFLSLVDSTIVILESPLRVNKTLNDILNFMGNRMVALCKEITKIHENVKFGYVKDIINEENMKYKGEYVILIANEKYEL